MIRMTQIVEFRVAIYDMCMYPQKANIPLQCLDRCAPTVGAISGLTAILEPSFGAISPVMDIHGLQKALWKTDQSTLASGGSEHA